MDSNYPATEKLPSGAPSRGPRSAGHHPRCDDLSKAAPTDESRPPAPIVLFPGPAPIRPLPDRRPNGSVGYLGIVSA